MLTPEQITEAKRIVAKAVENYSPERQTAFKILSAFRHEIAALRRKGAGFKAIADVLRSANVSVSIPTISRFCHDTPGLALAKPKAVKTASAAKATKPATKPPSRASKPVSGQRGVLGELPDGPRIADLSDL